MAKKQKKQKAGMLKRKQQKQTKKAISRRRVASRMPSKPSSEKELERLLQQLPTLAYEPELNDLRFDSALMQTPPESADSEPERIKNLVTPEFLSLLEERLDQAQERTSENTSKFLMVKGMRHMLETQNSFHFINPLIVAIYLRTQAELAGNNLEVSQILKAVEAYETEHMSVIENLVEALQKEETPAEAAETAPDEEPLPFDAPSPSPVDQQLLENYYETLSALDEGAAERIREDVEVFVEDFITQPVEAWNALLVDEFLGSWFIENLNPVADDLVSMKNSLEHFFQFLATQEKIPPPEMEKILSALQNKAPSQQALEP